MSQTESTTSPETKASPWWQRIPLTLQILIALVAAVSVGIALGAGNPNPSNATLINNLAIPAELVLKALRALATPDSRTAVNCHPDLNFCICRCGEYSQCWTGNDDISVHFCRLTYPVHCFASYHRLVFGSLPHCN